MLYSLSSVIFNRWILPSKVLEMEAKFPMGELSRVALIGFITRAPGGSGISDVRIIADHL